MHKPPPDKLQVLGKKIGRWAERKTKSVSCTKDLNDRAFVYQGIEYAIAARFKFLSLCFHQLVVPFVGKIAPHFAQKGVHISFLVRQTSLPTFYSCPISLLSVVLREVLFLLNITTKHFGIYPPCSRFGPLFRVNKNHYPPQQKGRGSVVRVCNADAHNQFVESGTKFDRWLFPLQQTPVGMGKGVIHHTMCIRL